MISSEEKKMELLKKIERFKEENYKAHEQADSNTIRSEWETFYQYLNKNYNDLGLFWQFQVLQMIQAQSDCFLSKKDA